MRHPPIQSWLFQLAALLFAVTSGTAQDIKFVVPTSYERATKTDDQGLMQWADHAPGECQTCKGTKETKCSHCARFTDNKKCPECAMKKTAPCRSCGGLGHWPDPLEQVHCPGCMGAGFFPCFVCGGRGIQKVDGSGDKIFDCVGCKGEGGFKCEVCDGKRLVEVVVLKPDVKNANLTTATKAKDQIADVLGKLTKFDPSGKNARKEVKDLQAILKPLEKLLPAIKRSPKALDEVMKKIYAGSVFVGHEENEGNAIRLWKTNTEYCLQHQQRLCELLRLRQEHNDKVLAGQKGK
jgi:hypothetical protein